MNKLLRNKWFVRVISFLIALMLYTVVSAEQPNQTSDTRDKGNQDQPKEMENVKLIPYYDDDEYVLSDLPKTVSVQLEGPEGSIQKASLSNSHEVFVDLTNKGAGTYTVPVKARGFPNDLTVHTTPAKVKITLQEKETKAFPVQLNLINKDQLADGYVAGDPEIEPEKVAITAGEHTMSRIAFVEGFVDIKDADDTVSQKVSLNIYDNKGNEMDLGTDPSSVVAKVPVEKQSKEVPVHVENKGSLPEDLKLDTVDLESDKVRVYGSKDVLDATDEVRAELDLSKINQDQTVELDVTKPNGADKVSPAKVEADVKVKNKSK